MNASFWIRLVRVLLFLILAQSGPLGWAGDLCHNRRPVDRVVVYYAREMPRAPAGLPLDEALEHERDRVDGFRAEAQHYFLEHSHPTLDRMRERYTFLFPIVIQERFGLGVPVAAGETSIAIKYRALLWKQYLERFTRVSEAPAHDPYTLRFEVSLDLGLFCRYRQEVGDLLTK
jgi:hypothetical protein